MEYVIYCDESRHDGIAKNKYMAIGGLWVPAETKPTLTREFRDLCRSVGLKAEVKWSKVSTNKLEAYKQLVDFFIKHPELRFRVIVIEHSKLDYTRFHGSDKELGFYRFYYEMLEKWIEPGNQYLILLDYKNNKGADRYTTLRTILERTVKGKAWIKDLTIINSAETPLAQLCDLLTGAVAASWCCIREGTAKAKLASHIAQGIGHETLVFESPGPAPNKLNIFRIRLQ